MSTKNKRIIINEFDTKELMEFIYCLNDNMREYDSNFERAMRRSERAEWESLKGSLNKGVSIQYAGSKR